TRIPWSFNSGSAPTGLDPGQAHAAIQAAFTVWSSPAELGFEWAEQRKVDIAIAAADGVNVVFWDEATEGEKYLARAYVWRNVKGEVTDFDIRLNSAYSWSSSSSNSGSYDLGSVMLHEVGHVLGLSHVADERAVMYPRLAAGEAQRSLSPGDLDRLYDLYEVPSSCQLRATLIGTDGDDVLVGTAGDDVIWAGAGDDWVSGLEGDDELCGGRGDDILIGGVGADSVIGGSGRDSIAGGVGDDLLLGGDGSDKLIGGEGDDDLRGGPGSDEMLGGRGDDRLQGDAGDDLLQGGRGADVLLGGPGSDRLIGNAGADLLRGNTGADVLIGGAGNDKLRGGPGHDKLQQR
ncbi:MAG: matrixin family metalloprotease, partial [Acidimicrobiales bacterium]